MALFFCPQLEYHSYHFKANHLPGLRVLVNEGVPLGLLTLFALSILDYPPLGSHCVKTQYGLVLTVLEHSEGNRRINALAITET